MRLRLLSLKSSTSNCWRARKRKYLFPKESGSIGGIREKIEGCQELGMDCVIISRPIVNYPKVVSTIEELANPFKERGEWMSGFVSLVGAGPGDEELISLKEHGD